PLTTHYPLSLHDALPISWVRPLISVHGILGYASKTGYRGVGRLIPDLVDPLSHEIYDVKSWNETLDGMIKVQTYANAFNAADPRSEEHTSELQSHLNLVC